MLRTLLVTLAIVALVSFLGCKSSGGDPVSVPPPDDATPLTKDDSVRANAYLVRDAVEAYQAVAGILPKSTYEPISANDSRTLIDFLPGGTYLINPYSGAADSPLSEHANYPGEVSYMAFGQNITSYVIHGVGAERGVEIIELLYDPAK